ncbi:MAG: YggT family protein [Bdellovibrionota bacterium]
MGQLLYGLGVTLNYILNMLSFVIIASMVISWVQAPPSNPLVSMIHAITEPLYRPFRRFARKIPGPLDWAPMIVILIIVFIQNGIIPLFLHSMR